MYPMHPIPLPWKSDTWDPLRYPHTRPTKALHSSLVPAVTASHTLTKMAWPVFLCDFGSPNPDEISPELLGKMGINQDDEGKPLRNTKGWALPVIHFTPIMSPDTLRRARLPSTARGISLRSCVDHT